MEHATDLGFAYRVHKTGEVTITRDGRTVTVLRGDAAREADARVAALAPEQRQTALAKITGRYKRGNERRAAHHPRNR